ncbi:hypothetical protein POM88_009562 [Heracleum sosnowskyi]|uniref:RNase H type-1 domain-containing protein n=1 Tax=Heracleum sosnowskyi TaxID=360622 RepID=A0AAD8J8Z2_9APIA|nr:hypothetical protein POM88_009562 [Heracleum sosnowskyi]
MCGSQLLALCGLIHKYYKALVNGSRTITQGDKIKWKPPPNDDIKINTNASFQEDSRTGGNRVVARDHDGQVVDSMSTFIPYALSAVALKLLAIKEGLLLATNNGCQHFILETDCVNANTIIKRFLSICSDVDVILWKISSLKFVCGSDK